MSYVKPNLYGNIVVDLQRGFVDEEDGFLHEVEQSAIGLVNTFHIRRSARRAEFAR